MKEVNVSDLEIGKWYSVLWQINAKEMIIKVNRIEDLYVHFSTSFYNDKRHLCNDGTFNKLECDNWKELSQEDLKQYLPKGHPDLKQESTMILIKGNIYVAEFADHKDWDSIFTSGGSYDNLDRLYINQKLFRKQEIREWAIREHKISFREATQDEKDWLAACNKANKYLSKEEALKKEETKIEVFPGIFVDDVVVSLEDVYAHRNVGDLKKVSTNSHKNILYYESNNGDKTNSCHENNWRKATLEEVNAYNEGIRNIKDIKKEEKYKPSVGDWVITKGYSPNYDDKPLKIERIEEVSHGTFCYFTPNKRYGDNFDVNHVLRKCDPSEIPVSNDPEYVECIRENEWFGKVGKIYKVKNYNHSKTDLMLEDKHISVSKDRFKPSTKEAFDAQNKSKSTINTHGLNIGDNIPECVLNKWDGESNNYYCDDNGWRKGSGNFYGDRKITKFDQIKGIDAFQVSGTSSDLWLKAKGFKEFMEKEFEIPLIKDNWYQIDLKSDDMKGVEKYIKYYKFSDYPSLKKKDQETWYEYVECLKDYSNQFTKGKVYKLNKSVKNLLGKVYLIDDIGQNNGWDGKNFKLSTEEAFKAQQNKQTMTPSAILEEAKKRYPIGTKYKCLHVENAKSLEGAEYEVRYTPRYVSHDPCHLSIEAGLGYIYLEGKWAEIVSKPAFDQEKLQTQLGKINISELKYPDVIHIETKEQYDKIRKFLPKERKLSDYTSDYTYYLIDHGKAKTIDIEAYLSRGRKYRIIEFSELFGPIYTTGIDPYDQNPAKICVELKSLEDNDERINTSLHHISSVKTNLVEEL